MLRHFDVFASRFVPARAIDVWMPDGLDVARRHPVVYLQDGQALFDPTLSWSHQAWRLDEGVGRLVASGAIPPVILVGIANTGYGRFAEYFPGRPWADLARRPGSGFPAGSGTPAPQSSADAYLRFLVEELMPFVERTFPAAHGPEHTFIAGSSLGGLISLYALCEYPRVFGGAACLSTHWTGMLAGGSDDVPKALLDYLAAHAPDPAGHRIYFDRGTRGLDAGYGPHQARADAILRRAGFDASRCRSLVAPGDTHEETAWGRRFPGALEFLLGRDGSGR